LINQAYLYKIGKIYQILCSEDNFNYPERSNDNTNWVDYREPFMLLAIKSNRNGLCIKVLTGKGFVLNIMIDINTEYLEELKNENQ
jgi:hypothetical protein